MSVCDICSSDSCMSSLRSSCVCCSCAHCNTTPLIGVKLVHSLASVFDGLPLTSLAPELWTCCSRYLFQSKQPDLCQLHSSNNFCGHQAGACSQHTHQGTPHASHTHLTSKASPTKYLCQHSKRSRQQTQIHTQCVAPNSQSVGRRVVGGVATAAFLTWALQSASAKSMKPGEVQKRSREEEDAAFENRQGEVTNLVQL